MVSSKLMYLLMAQYAVISIFFLYEGSPWKAVYFMAALTINFSVLQMR